MTETQENQDTTATSIRSAGGDRPNGLYRALALVGIAAGSGITPILSILASTLEHSAEAQFTLV